MQQDSGLKINRVYLKQNKKPQKTEEKVSPQSILLKSWYHFATTELLINYIWGPYIILKWIKDWRNVFLLIFYYLKKQFDSSTVVQELAPGVGGVGLSFKLGST